MTTQPLRYIDQAMIDARALEIVQQLQDAGHEAYIVGGCLRDLLLGLPPKDFDVATSAHPEQIYKLFRNSRLIGKRFRLAHVFFGRDIIEVATFRRASEDSEDIKGDNCYGSFEEDVIRRDFTMNALYYDPIKNHLRDELNGVKDIENGVIRIIGDPTVRYTEDPVRMLRAVRFIAKLKLQLEEETAQAIPKNRKRLASVPPARLADECQKLFLNGSGLSCFHHLRTYKLFTMLFPDVDRIFYHDNQAFAQYSQKIIEQALISTDNRIKEGKSVTLAFIFAAFLWPVFQLQYYGMLKEGRKDWHDSMHEAIDLVLIAANERVSIPMRLRAMIREIWALQAQLELGTTSPKRMRSVLAQPRFRAGYDFLLIRHQAGENLGELVEIWTNIQNDSKMMQEALLERQRLQRTEDDD